jgi:hypothetical protein
MNIHINELHLSCESGVCDTLLTTLQKNKCNTQPMPLLSTPLSLKIWETKTSNSSRGHETKLWCIVRLKWSEPIFKHITICFLLPIVTSPWQWKLKCCLIMVHLHVSLTKSWCTNLSYLFRLILFSLADPLILESPKVPLTFSSCTMD